MIYNFPSFPISKQLFHVPGAAYDGGITSGGARIISPEPGGIAMLEIQPSLQVNEWDYPLSSWLMSKTNGQILRVRLAPTPQIATAKFSRVPWQPDNAWSNMQNWQGDITATYLSAALEGTNVVVIDMSDIGQILQCGHVIGHENETYLIDDIIYDEYDTAVIITNPPLLRNVAAGDTVYFRPYFTGSIINTADFLQTYDAENNGAIQVGKITLGQARV